MSLEACPECLKEVSHDAEACPHCGAPRKPGRKFDLGVMLQLAMLLLALAFALPLLRQELPLLRDEFMAWRAGKTAADAAQASGKAPAAGKRAAASVKTRRPVLECDSPDAQSGVAQLWRDEVARELSAKMGHPGIPLDSARKTAARMKLGLSAIEQQFADSEARSVHCTAVVTVSEGAGFAPSVSDVTYSAELSDDGRALEVTLVYVKLPPL